MAQPIRIPLGEEIDLILKGGQVSRDLQFCNFSIILEVDEKPFIVADAIADWYLSQKRYYLTPETQTRVGATFGLLIKHLYTDALFEQQHSPIILSTLAERQDSGKPLIDSGGGVLRQWAYSKLMLIIIRIIENELTLAYPQE